MDLVDNKNRLRVSFPGQTAQDNTSLAKGFHQCWQQRVHFQVFVETIFQCAGQFVINGENVLRFAAEQASCFDFVTRREGAHQWRGQRFVKAHQWFGHQSNSLGILHGNLQHDFLVQDLERQNGISCVWRHRGILAPVR